MKLQNPFVTAGYESPEYFCDREQETADLIEALENDRNVTLMAPRRIGKTGLVENVFYRLKREKGYRTVLLDLFPAQNLTDFTKMFATSVFRSLETSWEKAFAAATTFLRSCRPTLTVNPADLSHKFSFDIAPTAAEATLAEVFEYIASRKERVVVAFDEFQQITEFPEKGVEALLRSHVQKMPAVGFVFAGSRQHLMREMFTSAKRPFYQSTQKMHLEVIGCDKYFEFAAAHFKAGGMVLPEDVFRRLYRRFGGITWYVQAVLNRLYGRRPEKIDDDAVSDVVMRLIREEAYDYKRWCELLPEGSLRLLKAIAREGVAKDVTSVAFVAKHGLHAPSSVSLSLSRLLDGEMLYEQDDGYVVYDRLFGMWLAGVRG